MKYTIIVDKQSSGNPSKEKREYSIDIEELRTLNGISDTLTVTTETAYVTRRLQLSPYGILSVLPAPKKEELKDLNITLFEGENYIYILNEEGNKISLSYVIKSDFTDTYPTRSDMSSAITQTAQSIELSVNQKLEEYSTTEEMNAVIKITADGINSEVSKKVGEDEIISKINQSAERISINADKINIDGKAVNFKTNIEETIGPFTNTDKTKVTNYLKGTGSLTPQEFEKYDINNDGQITVTDLVNINKAITNGGYFTFKGTYQIDPYSKDQTISIYNENSKIYTSIISLINNYFNSLTIGSLDTDYNIEDVRVILNSNGFYLQQKDSPNSVSIQVGDWFDNTSTSGISIMNDTSRIDIITQYDKSEISLSSNNNETIVKSSEIITPKLTQTSLESIKKNISLYNENVLETILNSNIYTYNLKSEKDTDSKHIGFVIGEGYKTPKQVINNEGNAIELYSAIGILWKGIQEQQKKIEELENKLKEVSNG